MGIRKVIKKEIKFIKKKVGEAKEAIRTGRARKKAVRKAKTTKGKVKAIKKKF